MELLSDALRPAPSKIATGAVELRVGDVLKSDAQIEANRKLLLVHERRRVDLKDETRRIGLERAVARIEEGIGVAPGLEKNDRSRGRQCLPSSRSH